MGRTGDYTLIHHGTVTAVATSSVSVLVDTSATGHSCAGCSLEASCGRESDGGKGGNVVVRAAVPEGMPLPEVGAEVSVGLPRGGAFRAGLIMLTLPMAVLLAVAVLCMRGGMSEGAGALTALGCSALCYVAIYFLGRRARSPWVLILK